MERLAGKFNKDVVEEMKPILVENVEFITNKYDGKYSRDPDDDKFINCARSGKIKYLISGDKDLLVLEKVHGVKIVEVSEFIEK